VLQIPFPLWRQNTTERARADAQLGIARAEQDEVRFRLRARLARAASEVDAAAERVEVYGQQVLPELESNLEMLRRGFELGEFSILDVSVARERFLRIQMEAFDAYADYFDAVAELEAEVGAALWPDGHAR
ncbi:MAG: TolC family protein, partial [Polyangiales bacterium]